MYDTSMKEKTPVSKTAGSSDAVLSDSDRTDLAIAFVVRD